MTIEQNPHVLAASSFDDGYNKSKQDILNIIDVYIKGPWPFVAISMLYEVKEEIEKL